ncbi:MAG TPA: hypothetical protein PLY16_00535 [Candidatus Saccharibacteria bacterium]|nr:hypothetical protein [Candidatus Saccharibacteria bacterium]
MELSKENESNLLEQLKQLELPEGEYMVMGSGILNALDIRAAEDIDMVVSARVYTQLKEAGWSERVFRSGSIEQLGLERGPFQVFSDWTDDDGMRKTVEELLLDADIVDGIAYNSLDKLYAYKLRRGLDKDLRDLQLIDEFRGYR